MILSIASPQKKNIFIIMRHEDIKIRVVCVDTIIMNHEDIKIRVVCVDIIIMRVTRT